MAVPLVPVKCPDPKCGRIAFERQADWRGDPVVVVCKKCGRRIEVTETGARFVG